MRDREGDRETESVNEKHGILFAHDDGRLSVKRSKERGKSAFTLTFTNNKKLRLTGMHSFLFFGT